MSQYTFTVDGFTWQGNWNSTQTYNPYDVVQQDGSMYVCVLQNTDVDPSTAGSPPSWQLAASIGATGSQGPSGQDLTTIGTVYTSTATISEKQGTILLGGNSSYTVTLPPPTSGTDDGKVLTILSIFTNIANTVNLNIEYYNGFSTTYVQGYGNVGFAITLVAYQGYWYTTI